MQGLQRDRVIVRVDRVGIEADSKDGIADLSENLLQFMLYNLNEGSGQKQSLFFRKFFLIKGWVPSNI